MSKHKRMVDTRRLYLFEEVFTKELPLEARHARPAKFLRAMVEKVWAKHGRAGLAAPKLKYGRGLEQNGVRFSFADGYSKIELSPTQRTLAVLLHELTHTIGYGTHGKGFVRKYIDLLVEYAGCDRGELELGMGMFGIRT